MSDVEKFPNISRCVCTTHEYKQEHTTNCSSLKYTVIIIINIIIDYSQSGIVYNFGCVCLSVCLSLCISVRR